MTMGVGQQVWERFGHNAIGIRDARTGTDQVYNYGVFSFQEKGFLLHFVRGRMMYRLESWDAESTVAAYMRVGRSVWVQELNFTPAQRVALRDFLEWNARPENKFYRYDYYLDNCSTRVRDALDRILGGVIQGQTEHQPAGTTFRAHTLRLTANSLPIWTGLLLAEGHPVDRPISQWQEMFLPLALRERLRNITVTGEDGRPAPLVSAEQTIFDSGDNVPDHAPRWWPGFLAVGLVLGGALAGSAARGRRGIFTGVSVVWLALTGLSSLVLLGLWLLTDHTITTHNENVLQMTPLALALAVLLPRGLRTGRGLVRLLALGIAGLSLLGLALKPFPGFSQANLTAIALLLPINLGLAYGVLKLMRGRQTPSPR